MGREQATENRLICVRLPAPLTLLSAAPIRQAQPRTGRTTIVITLSNQQGGASGICGPAERKAGREQASRSPVRSGGPIPP